MLWRGFFIKMNIADGRFFYFTIDKFESMSEVIKILKRIKKQAQ